MKTFNLYKRGDAQSPYYFKFNFRGQRYRRCTDFAEAEEAQRAARIIYAAVTEAVIRGDMALLDKTKIRHTPTLNVAPPITTTVDELTKAYKTGPCEASTKTRKQNIHALRQLLSVAYPEQKDIGLLLVNRIDATVSEKWFDSFKDEPGQQQAQEASNKRSGNSRFRQARSLFTPALLDHYRKKNLYSSTFEDFTSKGRARRFKKVNSSERYNAPNQDVITKTLDAWITLDDRNVFIAAGFALAFGLRAGEIAQVKWSYLQVRQNCPALVGVCRVKNGTGGIESRALDPFFSQMIQRVDSMQWRGKPDEYVLTGTPTERTGDVWRRLSSWMQSEPLCWETQKQAHALRAYSGSKVYQRYSPRAAQLFLAHASINVTEQFYSHFADKWPMSDEELEAMPEHWAINTALAQPVRVLQAAV